MRIHFALLYACALISCTNNKQHKDTGNEAHTLSYTVYSMNTELFVEFNPMITGDSVKFAVHFTRLGKLFSALTEGSVTIQLAIDNKKTTETVSSPSSPGIYRLSLMPSAAGKGSLTFIVKTPEFTDTLAIEDIDVFLDEETSHKLKTDEHNGKDIVYLKEQAWQTEFATMEIKRTSFREIIRTSGEILSAQGDETDITASSAGIIHLISNKVIAGTLVEKNEILFSISGSGLTESNVETRYLKAKADYEKTKADFERVTTLLDKNVIALKEYQDVKAQYENDLATYTMLSKNYSETGLKIKAPINGYLKDITVTEGEYVEAGQILAGVSQNRKLILRAEVSQKFFSKLSSITAANFKTLNDNKTYNTEDMNGRVLSFGKSVGEEMIMIPVSFEIENDGSIVSGSYAEVYLKSKIINDAIVVPITALIEEQGVYYVYVQTSGESFQKRELKTGLSDGLNMQILSGLTEGERVVTIGAYQIKAASMSGTIPAHGHSH